MRARLTGHALKDAQDFYAIGLPEAPGVRWPQLAMSRLAAIDGAAFALLFARPKRAVMGHYLILRF